MSAAVGTQLLYYTYRSLALKYGVGTSTISDIKKKSDKIKGSLEKCWKTILKLKNENDLKHDPEDLIPLSVMRQKIRSLAEEIDGVSSMLHNIRNVDIDVGETIDWIDSDAKLIEHENLIHVNDSADSDDDVMEIATLFRIKNEDAVKSLNLSLQWATENDIPLKDIMTIQNLNEIAFEKQQHMSHQSKITNFFQSVPKILKQGAQTSNEADEINVGESDEKVN
ncbi:hypothetical protein NQ314_019160 [Rhamnusium bicolor]|uniref:Uncharacterized protein n=1 Tax=Rhamnusium bicolor TaxID=1586634 RepID=A0AAV8WPD0_9CUCU|nr:hypothetical protein NQ314_019160 [Rhamnusium bicolor]